MRSLLNAVMMILQIIAFLAWLGGGLWVFGWYDSWLDEHFLWRLLAHVVALITIPILPLAVLVEWVWHGWPKDITNGFVVATIGGILFGILERLCEKLDLG